MTTTSLYHRQHSQLKLPLASLLRLLPWLLGACLLLVIIGCSSEPSRDNVVIVDDDDDDDDSYDRRYYSDNTRNVDHTYEILKIKQVKRSSNQNIKKWQDPNENADYSLLWARKGTKFEWQVKIIPEDGDTDTQFRFVIDDEDLPPPITIKNRSSSSDRFTFDVNLIDSFEDDDGEEVDINKWVDNNKQGNIYVQVQNVSYCTYNNDRNNNSTNSVDCSDKNLDSSYFKTQSVEMPYHLAFDGNSNELVCTASKAANIFEPTGIAKAAIQLLGRIIVPGSQCK